MKKSFLFLSLQLLVTFTVFAQDFSNKGKDFWVGYSSHVSMYSQTNGAVNTTTGGSQNLVLYFTSDQSATVTVEIYATGWKRTYNVAANSVTESDVLPKTGSDDVRLFAEGKSKKGIHITSTAPIVAYAHNYDGSVSGATLLFPTNTLGKEYYTLGFTQTSNGYYSYPFCFVIATEDNTVVETTLSAPTQNRLAGVPYYDTLQTGEVLNFLGQLNGQTGVDLTGTRIRSISTSGGGGCKKIAVFCGTGKLNIRCTSSSGTADNTIQQVFPSSAWGKKYITVPTKNMDINFFRVMVNNANTIVKLNGVPLSGIVNNRYYQFQSNGVNIVEADQPVIVAQYITSANTCGNTILGGVGDPEMIYLSPVEQTISKITLNSTTHAAINPNQHYINVAIRTKGAVTFTLDGVNRASNFFKLALDSNYSYAQFQVASGIHTLNSDTGFNAIAYGFGSAESYGYNAGTSIRDFTPVATFQNTFNRIDSAVTCVNSPFRFSVPLSIIPSTIQWDFSAAPNISPSANIGPLTSFTPDSSKSINGIALNYYSTNTAYTFIKANSAALRDTIKLYTTSATLDGCGSSNQVYTIPVTVRDKPAVPSFTITHLGCPSDSVMLTDQTPNPDGSILQWQWDLGDGSSVIKKSSQTFGKLYAPGTYSIKLKTINDIGCGSDSLIQVKQVTDKPVARFTVPAITCAGSNITFTDASTIQSGSIVKWTWDLANGAGPVTLNSNTAQVTKYDSFGIKDVKLLAESASGCKSDTFRISPAFTVNAVPKAGFVVPEICVTDATANFTDTTTVADGSSFTWNWRIAAGKNTGAQPTFISSTVQNAQAHVAKADIYQTTLKVTSSKGCVDSLTQPLVVNGPTPKASFTVQNLNGLCSNDSIRIVNTSTVDFGYLTRLDIYWDLINNPNTKMPDENPVDQKVYASAYANFQSPATKSYSVKLTAFSGNSSVCQHSITQIVTVNAAPKVNFSTLPGICNEAAPRQITQASYDARVPGTFVYTGTGVNNTGLYTPQSVSPGTYSIKYTYTSNKGCIDSAKKNITVWPSPLAKWGVTNPLCEKNDIPFTDSSVANYSKIVQWIWNYDNGKAAVTRTSGGLHTWKFDTSRIYNVSLKVLTDSGCTSTLNVQPVTVHDLPKPVFSLPSICLPDGRGQFTNQSSIADASEALFSYRWNFNDPNDPSSSTLKEPVHKYSALGPYPVQLKITTKDGCIDSLTQSLTTIYPQPKADFSISPAGICVGDTIRFKDLGNGITSNAVSWVWDLANGNTSNVQNPVKKYVDTGTFNISYYFFNGQGCVSDTAVKPLTIYPYPKLVMGPNLKVLEGGVITIKPKYVYGANLQYQWLPSTYLNSDTAATPKSTPADDITYKLNLTASGGCTVSDTIFIQVLRAPVVPNAFSPNGDGINDTWRIKYLESYPGASIDVYNRYGQVVFHSVGYDTDWDGTYKNQAVPVATYYYIINPKNGRQIITGSVTIIK